MRKTTLFVMLVFAVATCWTIGQVRAEVLVSDSFNIGSTEQDDINYGIGSPRQGGTLLPSGGVSYVTEVGNGGAAAVWALSAGNGPNEPEMLIYDAKNATTHGAWQDHDWTSAIAGTKYYASLHADYDTGYSNQTSNVGYLAVAETEDNLAGHNPATGVSARVGCTGVWQLVIGGSVASSGTITPPPNRQYDLTLGFDETGSSTAVSLFVNGSPVGSGSLTWGSSARYLGLGVDCATAYPSSMWVKDLSLNSGVYVPAPEPSSLAIVASGLLGLLAYAWRRRR
jgi:hypothetical protein